MSTDCVASIFDIPWVLFDYSINLIKGVWKQVYVIVESFGTIGVIRTLASDQLSFLGGDFTSIKRDLGERTTIP